MITSKINPPVIAPAIFNPLIISFFVVVPLKISLRARNPRSGIQNSAITRVMVTALNLLYPGKYSIKKFEKGMKFFPQASITDNAVAARSHHFSGPLIRIRPRTKRNRTIAPT